MDMVVIIMEDMTHTKKTKNKQKIKNKQKNKKQTKKQKTNKKTKNTQKNKKQTKNNKYIFVMFFTHYLSILTIIPPGPDYHNFHIFVNYYPQQFFYVLNINYLF